MFVRPQQRRSAGLLLSAVRARDIDRHSGGCPTASAARRSAANVDSAMLTAELTRLNTDLLRTEIVLVFTIRVWVDVRVSGFRGGRCPGRGRAAVRQGRPVSGCLRCRQCLDTRLLGIDQSRTCRPVCESEISVRAASSHNGS